MIRNIILSEIEHEKQLLKRLKKMKDKQPGTILLRSGADFYFTRPGEKKRHYIRRSDYDLLRDIVSSRTKAETIKILENNISSLDKMLVKLKDYDRQSILESLPGSYRGAELHFTENAPMEETKVFQSENPFRRKDLVISCSNGLLVRSREEAIIAELLLQLGIDFRYEKGLTLKESVTMSNGSVITVDKTVYPDFTITLADGSSFYIEHAGRLDDIGYREDFFKRFTLYLANGICSPKNLFISMASPSLPINVALIRMYVETQILPLCLRSTKI